MGQVATAPFVAVLALAGLGAATGSSGAEQEAAGRVLLAEVFNGENRPLAGLEGGDFVVDEGGEPREVFAAYAADYPIVLLLDAGIEEREFETIRLAAERFITRVGQRPVILGTLSQPASMLTVFGDERSVLLGRLSELSPIPDAPLVPLEAFANAAGALRDAGPAFSAIVAIASRPEDPAQIEEPSLLTAILEQRAVIHVIVNGPPLSPTPEAPTRRNQGLLRDLASQTGGLYTPIYSASSYAASLDRVADRLATEIMIEYLVPPGSTAGSAVRVGVRIPGARVRGLGVSR